MLAHRTLDLDIVKLLVEKGEYNAVVISIYTHFVASSSLYIRIVIFVSANSSHRSVRIVRLLYAPTYRSYRNRSELNLRFQDTRS